MRLLRILISVTLLLISPVANAKDVYVDGEETSQNGAWEYYVRTETINVYTKSGSGHDFSVKVFRVGKDKQNKGYPPLELTYSFINEGDGLWYTVYNNMAQRPVGEARRLPESIKYAKDKRDFRASVIFNVCKEYNH